MTTFVYKAKKSSAETVIGQIKAHSQDEAIELIHELGLLPVTVEMEGIEKKDVSIGLVQKVGTKELYHFSRQMANLLKSGVSLLRALIIMEEQTERPYFKKVIARMTADIKDGHSFS